jgi:hypothetical protein
MFRTIEASKFLQYFASDRSHMMHSGKEPPIWPCIRGAGSVDTAMNLPIYWDMTVHVTGEDERYGKVYKLDELIHWIQS